MPDKKKSMKAQVQPRSKGKFMPALPLKPLPQLRKDSEYFSSFLNEEYRKRFIDIFENTEGDRQAKITAGLKNYIAENGYNALPSLLKLSINEASYENDVEIMAEFFANYDINFVSDRVIQEKKEGKKWQIIAIAPGLSKSTPPIYWSDSVLQQAAEKFEGLPVNAYSFDGNWHHLPDKIEDMKKYLVSNNVGRIKKSWYVPGIGVKAEMEFYDKEIANQMVHQELSIDSRISGYQSDISGTKAIIPTKIIDISSLDIVTKAAAGGRFVRALQEIRNTKKEKKMSKKLLKIIKESRPELFDGVDIDSIENEEEIEKIIKQSLIYPEEKKETPEKISGLSESALEKILERVMQGSQGGKSVIDEKVIETLMQKAASAAFNPDSVEEKIRKVTDSIEQRAACGRLLDKKLTDSGLPETAMKRIRKDFDDKIFSEDELITVIRDEKEYLAQMNVPVFGLEDQGRTEVGINEAGKLAIAVDKMFGLTKEDVLTAMKKSFEISDPNIRIPQSIGDVEQYFDTIKPYKGLKKLYLDLTGDETITGRINPDKILTEFRASQAITTASFTYALSDSMNRRLIKTYLETNFREDLLISNRKAVSDYRTQELVMVGYFPDIASVDTESADIAEIAAITDERSTYAVGKKANILTITDKIIINDDIDLIKRMVDNLGRAARRTHAKYVWNFFKNNSNCSDGTAWFTSGHGNLSSTGLTTVPAGIAAVMAMYQALVKMTEKDSGEPIGIIDNMTLVYPIDIMDVADGVVNEPTYFASNDLTTERRNPLRGKIRGEAIPLLTDVNDWGLLRDPALWEMVEMGYLYGKQEPDLRLLDNPQTSEQMFVADKIRWRLTHIYGGALGDFRSAAKGVVA